MEKSMATFPYISGVNNITQMLNNLKKNFPQTVSSETVKKYGLASNNESYVINVLQFLRLIDADSKRTETGHNVMTIHDEEQFRDSFGKLIKTAYNELFQLRGEDAWTLQRDDLITFFRSSDKTSDIIGGRQAAVFIALREFIGYEPQPSQGNVKPKSAGSASSNRLAKSSSQLGQKKGLAPVIGADSDAISKKTNGDLALTVRIEINLPAEGSKDTYDAIFKSIKANLFP